MAKKITIFESYYEAAKDLPPEEFKQFFTAIFERAFFGIEPELDGIVKMMYSLVKPNLEKSLELSEIRAAAGSKGGAPKGNTNAVKQPKTSKNNQKQPKNKQKQADKDKEKDKEKDKDKEIEKETPTESRKRVADAPRFVKPTVAEVSAYCQERGNGINPESFIDFYESKGWKIGSNPMKDWKAAVRTWEQRRKADRASPARNSFNSFPQNSYNMSELERQLLDN